MQNVEYSFERKRSRIKKPKHFSVFHRNNVFPNRKRKQPNLIIHSLNTKPHDLCILLRLWHFLMLFLRFYRFLFAVVDPHNNILILCIFLTQFGLVWIIPRFFYWLRFECWKWFHKFSMIQNKWTCASLVSHITFTQWTNKIMFRHWFVASHSLWLNGQTMSMISLLPTKSTHKFVYGTNKYANKLARLNMHSISRSIEE